MHKLCNIESFDKPPKMINKPYLETVLCRTYLELGNHIIIISYYVLFLFLLTSTSLMVVLQKVTLIYV